MTVRALLIDDAFRAECGRLRRFAEDPKNWYLVGQSDFVPGNREEYVLRTDFGFRVVLTITHAPEHRPEPFRHMTISVPGDLYPDPAVVFTVAHHLGFTGATVEDGGVATAPGPWAMVPDEREGCVVVQEPYEVPMQ